MAEAGVAATPDRQRGVDRVIDIFEALFANRRPMRVGDIARALSAPRSTIYNLVNRLVAAELLEISEPDGSVFFGRAMRIYGAAYDEGNPLQRRAQPVLEQLAAKAGATAQLCALRGAKYVVLDSRSGRSLFRITGDIGVPVPLPWTASGRLLLDHLSAEQIRLLVPKEDFVLPNGQSIAAEQFVMEVRQAKDVGYFVTSGLSDQFACCLAAPVRNARQIAIATLCFIVPIETPQDRQRELLEMLKTSAADLSSSAQ